MNAATIPLRPWSSTISDPLTFEPADSTRYKSVAVEDERTEPPAALRFEHEVARFQRTVGSQRDAARSAIIKKVLAADGPDEYIQTALRVLVSSAQPGRLDDAVDILSECGRVLEQFVCEVLTQPEATEVDEDYWYALIRGMGKSGLPSARPYIELLWSKSPEAAVEALGDIGDDESLTRLRAVATGDQSGFVRQSAAMIVAECSE